MSKMLSSPVVLVDGVSHSFGKKKVLNDVSFSLNEGESLAIVGPSGSGKTTLLSCILGLITPRHGTVSLLGTSLKTLSRSKKASFRARHMGMVFQNGELLDELTAEENVALPALFDANNKKHALQDARILLDSFGVNHASLARVLSGGEQQRTALARALINHPEIILADEPTGSLDTELRDTVADTLFTFPATHNCALIVVTHDPTIAQRADRTITIKPIL